MRKVTWRNLVARKIRLALSAFAIVLGVAFVAGSFIFTDALGGAFNGIIKGTTADVEVAPKNAGDFASFGQDARTIPANVVDKLAALPGAADAQGTVEVQGVYVISEQDKLVGGNGPPGLAFDYDDTTAITGKRILTLERGQLPRGDAQVALDEATAGKAGYQIGDEVTLVTPGKNPTMQAQLTGIVKFGSEGGLVGATLTIFDEQALQGMFFEGDDVYTSISLTTADGVSQQELTDAANKVLPKGVVAETGDAVAKKNEDAIGEALGFINKFLLIFAGVSMVVGTFLIINTFSILVAQRSRELALLRALGASRRQVNRAVLTEALVVGMLGSLLGIGVGYLLAIGLKALFGAIGLDLAGADLPIQPRTVVVSLVVGLLVTLLAAYLPARRASRIAPVAAMRDEVAMPESTVRRRLVIGSGLVFLGIASMVVGFIGEGGAGLSLTGAGMLGVLVGVSLMSPVVGRPVIVGLGALYRRAFGTVGVLAKENSLRNPRRTAATASALMIGLTLVALMSILGASAKKSTDQAIDESLTAELIVSNAIAQDFSPQIAEQIRSVDGVASVAQFRQAGPEVGGEQVYVGATDPTALASALKLPMDVGGLSALDDSAVLVSSSTAKSKGYEVGDQVAMKFPKMTEKLTVAGVYPSGGALFTDYLVTLDAMETGGYAPRDSLLYITKEPGVSESQVRAGIDAVLEGNPTVTLKNQKEFADEQKQQINQLLAIVYALLGLAVVIAVLGIVNTLALSVIERTREVGLLRAVGVTRRQLRRMVRLESVAIAVLGAVLGVILGVAFGIALQRALADQGIDVLSVPWVQLAIFVLVSALVGVLAAVLPAMRAAKLDVLRAITTE
ncbi:MAG: ABC transporter permease [Nocardioidaceae bacterium]